jgi:hypothetical protein
MSKTRTLTTPSTATMTADAALLLPAATKTTRKLAKSASKALTSKLNLTDTTAAAPTGALPPRQTKATLLRTRLAEPGGASLAALIEATGWQAHTLRAALTGLRKAGLILTRRREGTDTIYAIDTCRSGEAVTAAAADQTTAATGRGPAPQDGNDGVVDAVLTARPIVGGA